MIYLASPYSHADPQIEYQRFVAAVMHARELMRQSLVVFSPIAHSVPIERLTDLHGDWQTWKRQDEGMIDRAFEVRVLQLPGWETSVGVTAEIDYARSKGKAITRMAPIPACTPAILRCAECLEAA